MNAACRILAFTLVLYVWVDDVSGRHLVRNYPRTRLAVMEDTYAVYLRDPTNLVVPDALGEALLKRYETNKRNVKNLPFETSGVDLLKVFQMHFFLELEVIAEGKGFTMFPLAVAQRLHLLQLRSDQRELERIVNLRPRGGTKYIFLPVGLVLLPGHRAEIAQGAFKLILAGGTRAQTTVDVTDMGILVAEGQRENRVLHDNTLQPVFLNWSQDYSKEPIWIWIRLDVNVADGAVIDIQVNSDLFKVFEPRIAGRR